MVQSIDYYYRVYIISDYKSLISQEYLIDYRRFPVIKHTPKGSWVGYPWDKHFILNTSKKKYAYPTKKEAFENYLKRTEMYISILRSRLETAEAEFAYALSIKDKQ